MQTPNKYLELIRLNLQPHNFWCSEEFFDKADWIVATVYDEVTNTVRVLGDDGGTLFPPITPQGRFLMTGEFEVWADIQGVYPAPWAVDKYFKMELDREYLYNPVHFQDLRGKSWAVFRKNIAKWKDWPFTYTNISHVPYNAGQSQALQLLVYWLRGHQKDAEDAGTLAAFVRSGEHRKALVNSEGKILGVNVWDYGPTFINYRVCIAYPMPYLQEYLRWLFYTDPEIKDSGKLVNDGGDLGQGGLRRFKEKLNPVQVRTVHSWRLKDGPA